MAGLIVEFDAGLLPLAEGTTLRSFLAKMLNCNPKRVSKKYDGNPIYDGKAVYARAKFPPPNAEAIARQENLMELELKFREALLTIQRVESRLQSLTGQMEKQEKDRSSKSAAIRRSNVSASAKAAAGKVQVLVVKPWQSNSAVSSLTDEESAAMDADTDPTTKMEETSTVVAQVSQSGGYSPESKPAAVASMAGTDEEAASRVLLQMNASKPRLLPSAAASAPSVASREEFPQRGELLLKKLYESNAHPEAANNSQLHEPPSGVATNFASLQPPQAQVSISSNTNGPNQANLQTMVESLNDIRQRHVQQTSSTSEGLGQPNLQGFFSGAAATALVSPLRQPVDTRQNLQELLQLIQQQPSSAPSFLPQSANLMQPPQLGAFNPPNVYQILQQQASQSPQSVESLIAQALGGYVPPPVPAPDNMNAALLQLLMQQSSAAAQQATPQAAFQETFQLLLQSFLQAHHDSQVQQQAASTLQDVVNSLVSQAFSQAPQPQQEPSLDNVLAALVSQMSQNNVAPQQLLQQITWPPPPANQTQLTAMLHQCLQPPQAPKPPAMPLDVAAMQILLAQLQQTQQ